MILGIKLSGQWAKLKRRVDQLFGTAYVLTWSVVVGIFREILAMVGTGIYFHLSGRSTYDLVACLISEQIYECVITVHEYAILQAGNSCGYGRVYKQVVKDFIR